MTLSLSPEKVGTWALREILRSAQVNKIASELVKAIDGVGGGVYTLAGADLQLSTSAAKKFILNLAAEILTGKTLTVDAGAFISLLGTLNVQSGGQLDVLSGAVAQLQSGGALNVLVGAVLDIAGEAVIESGADLSVQSGGAINVQSGGAVNLLAGALMDVLGGITLEATSLLDVLNNATINVDAGGHIVTHQSDAVSISDTGGTNTGAWFGRMMPMANTVAGKWQILDTGVVFGLEQVDTSSAFKAYFAVPLLPGDQCTSVTVKVSVASQPGFTLTKPKITLFRVDSSGNRTDIAARTDPSATQGAYETTHDILLDATHVDSGAMPFTVNTQALYVEVAGQTGANATTNALVLLGVRGASIQRAYRVPIEVG